MGHSRPPEQAATLVTARYFGALNTSRHDRWVFDDRHSAAYLLKFAWTKIVRHQMVHGAASPDDPALTASWAERHPTSTASSINRATLRLLQTQGGRCLICRGLLLPTETPPASPAEWERWLRATRQVITTRLITYRAVGTSSGVQLRLIHSACHSASPPTAVLHTSSHARP